jgi:hydroxypyruvate isomerase
MPMTFTVNCSTLFTDLPLLERPRAARDAGFEAVEFRWPFASPAPADVEVNAFVGAILDAGVQLTGLGFAAGTMAGGDVGILCNPAMTEVFLYNVGVAVDIAEILGTRVLNALYGIRSNCLPTNIEDSIAAENLSTAAWAAARIEANVLIEPISGAPRYPLKTAADVVAVIDRVKNLDCVTNLGLLADIYHLYVNGDDVPTVIRNYGDHIGHVQLADAPGRGEPDTGDLPLEDYLGQLAACGYQGYVGLEYLPTRPDPFDWLPRAERGVGGATEFLGSRSEAKCL